MESPKDIFASAAPARFEASPYLKTRVLARVSEKLERRRRRPLAFAGLLATAAGVLFAVSVLFPRVNVSMSGPFKAVAGEELAVRIDVRPLRGLAIAQAEIELPEGVVFRSMGDAGIDGQRRAVVSWNEPAAGKTHFPFIIEGDTAGDRMVTVKFYAKNRRLLATRVVSLKFVSRNHSSTLGWETIS